MYWFTCLTHAQAFLDGLDRSTESSRTHSPQYTCFPPTQSSNSQQPSNPANQRTSKPTNQRTNKTNNIQVKHKNDRHGGYFCGRGLQQYALLLFQKFVLLCPEKNFVCILFLEKSRREHMRGRSRCCTCCTSSPSSYKFPPFSPLFRFRHRPLSLPPNH
jgi:hypothetical protein